MQTWKNSNSYVRCTKKKNFHRQTSNLFWTFFGPKCFRILWICDAQNTMVSLICKVRWFSKFAKLNLSKKAEKEQSLFKREGNDLALEKRIPLVKALVGYTFFIPPLCGTSLLPWSYTNITCYVAFTKIARVAIFLRRIKKGIISN